MMFGLLSAKQRPEVKNKAIAINNFDRFFITRNDLLIPYELCPVISM
jgi:hypothetical protein